MSGALIGALIIGAGILALLGVGAVWLSSGNKQQKRLYSAPQQDQLPQNQAPPDPLDAKSTDELRLQAGEMLVAADNAVASSEQELLFASASYGDDQVKPFQKDIDEAKSHLRESFRLQQQVDQSHPEGEAEAREFYKRIIHSCEKVNQTLQSHQQEFEGLRNLERNPEPVLQQLRAHLAELKPRHEQAHATLQNLAISYDDDALDQYRDNLDQAGQALTAAEQAVSAATDCIARADTAEAVLALHSGEQAAADANALLDSMEQTEDHLRKARRNLDIGIAQTTQDIAQAKATYQAGQAPELAGPIAAAESAVERTQRALDSGRRINPLELLHGLELVHRELDEPLNSVRDRQAQDRRARDMLQNELLTARSQVQSSLDFLRSRRYGVSSTARTRMAEAERCLTEAESIGESQPSRAVELAQRAKALAVQAAQIAQQEAATNNMQNMGGSPFGRTSLGGGYGYGTGGGFGGFGTGGGTGFGGTGYGGSAMGGQNEINRALRTGMRMARMTSRGGRRRRRMF